MGASCVVRRLGAPVLALAVAGCAAGARPPDVTALDETAPGAVTGSLLAAPSEAILRRCHKALVNAATPYGLLKGTISSLEGDGTVAPVLATIVYRRQGGPETRAALVNCHLNPDGEVVGFTER
jgi:hypothetical protein